MSSPSSSVAPSSACSSGAPQGIASAPQTLAVTAAEPGVGRPVAPGSTAAALLALSAGGSSTRTSSRGCDCASESYTNNRRSYACAVDTCRQSPRSRTYSRVLVAAAARRSMGTSCGSDRRESRSKVHCMAPDGCSPREAAGRRQPRRRGAVVHSREEKSLKLTNSDN
eukprot:scaffold9837_cov94-Isochrysis_galbana.AAC.2